MSDRIYLVTSVIGRYDKDIAYVGHDVGAAVETFENRDSSVHPAYVHVWADGEHQFVTRDPEQL